MPAGQRERGGGGFAEDAPAEWMVFVIFSRHHRIDVILLTLTRSRNREDIDTLLLLLTLECLLASKEGRCMLWLGFQGPVGDGRPPTSRLMMATFERVLTVRWFV